MEPVFFAQYAAASHKGREPLDWKTYWEGGDLSAVAQRHLVLVYLTCAVCLLAYCAAAYADVALHIGGPLPTLGLALCAMGLFSVKYNPKNRGVLLFFTGAASFLKGATHGWIFHALGGSEPSGLRLLALGMAAVFLAFLLPSLVTRRRPLLFLVAMCASAAAAPASVQLGCHVFGAPMENYLLQVSMGTFSFAVYVMFYSQVVAERAAAGRADFAMDSLQLFFNFWVAIYSILKFSARLVGLDHAAEVHHKGEKGA